MIVTKVCCIRAFNATSKVRFSHRLYHFISLPPNFLISNLGFHILGALLGSRSFVKSFVAKAFHEDLGTISNLPMFVDLQAAFEMFLFCYAQHLRHLLRTVFPF
jgi:hypothetical protein